MNILSTDENRFLKAMVSANSQSHAWDKWKYSYDIMAAAASNDSNYLRNRQTYKAKKGDSTLHCFTSYYILLCDVACIAMI